jgi:hypothetical protein
MKHQLRERRLTDLGCGPEEGAVQCAEFDTVIAHARQHVSQYEGERRGGVGVAGAGRTGVGGGS